MGVSILTLIYIVAAVTFIMGLKMMSHPDSARKGNMVAGVGMLAAIFGTIFLYKNPDGSFLGNYSWIFGAIIIGSVIGTLVAKKVKINLDILHFCMMKWVFNCKGDPKVIA